MELQMAVLSSATNVTTTLESHYKKVHTDREFSFRCDQCEKRFKTKNGFKDHVAATHLKIKYD